MLLRSLLKSKTIAASALGLGSVSGLLLTTSSAMASSSSSLFVDPSMKDGKKAKSIYDFRAVDIDGNMVNLDTYKGHPCIIVNVASFWGKTNVNYTQLQEIYSAHQSEGLRILAFPCNQFGSQEPKSEAEIKTFATEKYNVTFDMFSKINVNGSQAHPLFDYLKNKQSGFMMNAIKWNFSKFLVDKNGVAVARFGPTDDPNKMIPKIKEILQ